MRIMRFVAFAMLSGVLITSVGRADIIKDLGKVFNGHAVQVEVTNETKNPVYVYVDATGRHGDGVTMDKVNGPDGKPMPPGLIIEAGKTRTFGDAVGGGDAPTIHIDQYDASKKLVSKEVSTKKVGPDEYGADVLKLKTPAIRLIITESGVKVKGE